MVLSLYQDGCWIWFSMFLFDLFVLLPEYVTVQKSGRQLKKGLRKAQLHNKLLNAIIGISEEQLKIDIRKKSGTKQ